jgi:3-deoxy-D-manno-octulosonate 8-phosphate phosphatase (KDO 8-P phosphatase)
MDTKMKFIGQFTESELQVAEKLKSVKAFIFDWDGVFNNGFKQGQNGSGFSEVDSMGTNLLRFSHYLSNHTTPVCAIISGENNEAAQFFAKREHFDFAFHKIAHKIDALQFICREKNIKPEQVCYFFDDVLDLSIAKVCGLRIIIRKNATELFNRFCVENNLVDYITHNDGLNHGVREACEMLMTINGNFHKVLHLRTEFDESYKTYLKARNLPETLYYTRDQDGKFIKTSS